MTGTEVSRTETVPISQDWTNELKTVCVCVCLGGGRHSFLVFLQICPFVINHFYVLFIVTCLSKLLVTEKLFINQRKGDLFEIRLQNSSLDPSFSVFQHTALCHLSPGCATLTHKVLSIISWWDLLSKLEGVYLGVWTSPKHCKLKHSNVLGHSTQQPQKLFNPYS